MKETRSVLPGVNGLHADDIDRENRKPTVEGLRR